MAYKILYVEDLDPGSIIHDLNSQGFDVIHYAPEKFEETIKSVDGYDLLLIDFRLTDKTAIFDAPTVAQALRTLNSESHKDIPIVLISTETNIRDYYKDLTSKDLFDFSLTKSALMENLKKHSSRFEDVIEAYKTIINCKFDPAKVLEIPEELLGHLDYRIFEKLNNEIFKSDTFAFSSFIVNNLLRSIGPLIGEDVLAARLGVDKNSPDWAVLRNSFDNFKYVGVFSKSYHRWWNDGLVRWWNSNFGMPLRRLSAEQRVSKLKELTSLDLLPQPISQYAKSSNFWTICKDLHVAIDPIDGLELNKKELLPWQETEYLSIQAAFAPKTFDGKQQPLFIKYLKPIERKRLNEIAKTL